MRAEEIIRRQGDLVQRFRDNRFHSYIKGSLSSEYASRLNNPDAWSEIHTISLAKQVELADCFRVTPDMCDLVQWAAAGLDESDIIDRTLPPTVWGLVRFEKPLQLKEVHGEIMLAHWMTWGPAGMTLDGKPHPDHDSAVFVTFWNDPFTEPDKSYLDGKEAFPNDWLVEVVGPWAFIGAEVMLDGNTLGPAEVPLTEAMKERTRRVMAENVEHNPGLEAIVYPENDLVPFTNSQRYAHALWLLLNQTIVLSEREKVPTRALKRFPKLPGRVNVIVLRKRSDSTATHPESDIEWQHRWLVRGHWAWRVCGPDHPGAREAPVKGGIGVRLWINGYVKGPEDKPLMQTTHVYQLSR